MRVFVTGATGALGRYLVPGLVAARHEVTATTRSPGMLVSLLRRARILGASLRLAWVNGQPGAVLYDAQGRVVSVLELDVAGGVVQAMHAVVNPDKLGHLGPVSDVARRPERRTRPGGQAAGGGA